MGEDSSDKWQRADDEVRKSLPPGVKLVRMLRWYLNMSASLLAKQYSLGAKNAQ